MIDIPDCIFCLILSGNLPSSLVYRDELCAAFLDIYPVNMGHLLVVPLQHAANLAELDPETGAHLFKTAQRLAAALRHSGLPCDAINLFLADGEVAGQEVFHVHLHILPRFKGDGFNLRLPPGYPSLQERQTLDQQAEMIRDALQSS